MFTLIWSILRNKCIRSDGRTWPWPASHLGRKIHKFLFQLKKRLTREVEIVDEESSFRFRCENITEFGRCMKMFVKEPGTCDWIRNSVKEGDVFYDVGANIGIYTVLAANRVGKSGRVFAFEPHSPTFSRLLENIAANHLEGVVAACNFALHETQGFFPFVFSSPDAGASNSQLDSQSDPGRDKAPQGISELKYSASVDSLVAAGSFPAPDHVKIDVDGNELLILRGMARLLQSGNGPRSIQVEINDHLRADILAFMQSHDYALAHEHHTRKGAELLARGGQPEEHAYNVIFRPAAP